MALLSEFAISNTWVLSLYYRTFESDYYNACYTVMEEMVLMIGLKLALTGIIACAYRSNTSNETSSGRPSSMRSFQSRFSSFSMDEIYLMAGQAQRKS